MYGVLFRKTGSGKIGNTQYTYGYFSIGTNTSANIDANTGGSIGTNIGANTGVGIGANIGASHIRLLVWGGSDLDDAGSELRIYAGGESATPAPPGARS